MDQSTHKRFLEYRDLHVYFGGKKPLLTAAEFTEADMTYAELFAKGDDRDDEEEVRFAEVANLIHRD